MPRQPDFLIIGAAKSATSWLTECLIEHPGVVIPKGELNHFSWDYDPSQPLPATYLDYFRHARPDQTCGENSNTYLSHPDAARRIHAALPDARLVVSLRNPVDRAYSDWAMRLSQQYRFEDQFRFLDPDLAPDIDFLHKGLYCRQIAPFVERFGRDRLHVILMEDVKGKPEETFAGVCRFLGIDDTVRPKKLHQRVNARGGRMIMPRLRERLTRYRAARRVIDLVRASPLHAPLHRLLAHGVTAPPLDPDIRRKLLDYYRDDVADLSRFLGRDLSHWTGS